MLFADVSPLSQPKLETVVSAKNDSQLALIERRNGVVNTGQKITHVQIQIRGGKTRRWQIAQRGTASTPEVLEVMADRQTYNPQTQVITAEGNVTVRFAQGVLVADELKINTATRLAVGTGNISFRRGEQVLNGDRFEYNFLQDEGVIENGSGEIYQPTLDRDVSFGLSGGTAATLPATPLTEPPIQDVTQDTQFQFGAGGGGGVENFSVPETGGGINRLRFAAEEIVIDGGNWTATNVRLTNDPFSPPELEVRADTAEFRQLGPLRDEIVTSDQRLVFDDGLSVPIPRNRIVLDQRERSPGIVNFGFDSDDRGGLYVEREFTVFNTPQWNFSVTPQYFVQQAFLDDSIADPGVLGIQGELTGQFSPRTTLTARGEMTGFEEDVLEDNLRGSIRLQQAVGRDKGQHRLNLEASYRDRLFNGSLGFQTVQSSIGAVIASPNFTLGDSGINFRYQGGVQRVNAETDVQELLEPNRENNRVTLTRYQAATELSWGTSLWQGESLPATQEEGLRYTPTPVHPNLRLQTGVTGVTSLYSNGDDQNSLSLSVGLRGQLGHFSKNVLDYTSFNVTYTQALGEGESPFKFDRLVDRRRLSLGVLQQIYGPVLGGVQASINLDDGEVISSDFILEYSRRTYNLRLRYNPTQEIGSVSIRINGFNWDGSADAFENVQTVEDGVIRE